MGHGEDQVGVRLIRGGQHGQVVVDRIGVRDGVLLEEGFPFPGGG